MLGSLRAAFSPTVRPCWVTVRLFSTVPKGDQSYVARGTAFEDLAASSLGRIGFYLRTRGGPHDAGVDLKGTWELGGGLRSIPVIVQCKRQDGTIAVSTLRDFTSCLKGAWATAKGLGVFVSNQSYSRDCLSNQSYSRDCLRVWKVCPHPLALCVLSDTNGGVLESFALNVPAQRLVPTVNVVDMSMEALSARGMTATDLHVIGEGGYTGDRVLVLVNGNTVRSVHDTPDTLQANVKQQ